MDYAKQEKLRQFINNPTLSEAVKSELLRCFLKKKSGEDVNTKAARFIATELLHEAWQELEGYKVEGVNQEKPNATPHV